MPGPFQEVLAAMQSVGRWCYVIAGVIWVGAVVFAAVRIYQIGTQVLVPAVVLDSRLLESWQKSQETDVDGFRRETASLSHYRLATVRYEVNGKPITAEIGRSGTGFRWIEERAMRQWQPGARIRVRIDRARPDKPKPALGLNYPTFDAAFGLVLGGFLFAGFGWAMIRAVEFLARKMETYLPIRGQ